MVWLTNLLQEVERPEVPRDAWRERQGSAEVRYFFLRAVFFLAVFFLATRFLAVFFLAAFFLRAGAFFLRAGAFFLRAGAFFLAGRFLVALASAWRACVFGRGSLL